jgi:hypothetical protein
VNALGRGTDRLAGAMRGGWDRLTGTVYRDTGWPRQPSGREYQAITRQLRGKPARNAYERAAYSDSVLVSNDDGKTWMDRRLEMDDADRPEKGWAEREELDAAELDALERDWEQRAADYWGGEGPDFEAAAMEGVTPEQLADEEPRGREWAEREMRHAAEVEREAEQ